MLTKYLGAFERIARKPEGPVASLAEMKIKQDLPRGPQKPRFIPPDTVKQEMADLGGWASSNITSSSVYPKHPPSPPSHPQTKRDAAAAFRKDAKKFWDLFKLKSKSRSEEVILPIKVTEIFQEVCNMLPFSQVNVTNIILSYILIRNAPCYTAQEFKLRIALQEKLFPPIYRRKAKIRAVKIYTAPCEKMWIFKNIYLFVSDSKWIFAAKTLEFNCGERSGS